MSASSLEGGFNNAPVQSAQSFRTIMNVMAKPGTIEKLSVAAPPAPLSTAAGSLLLTLCDAQTPIYLAGSYDNPELKEWITFHCNAPFADAQTCVFALGCWEDLLPLNAYQIGAPEYPDRSATLVIEMETLSVSGAELSGPGIQDKHYFSLPALDVFQENAMLFPLGLDFYFTSDDQIAALPRTTKIKPIGERV